MAAYTHRRRAVQIKEMQTTLKKPVAPKTKATTRTIPKGTPVRVAGENEIFFIQSPAEWGGPGYATATHYNLRKSLGRISQRVDARKISLLPPEEHQAAEILDLQIRETSHPPIHTYRPISRQESIHSRMLKDPAGTIRMAVKNIGSQHSSGANRNAGDHRRNHDQPESPDAR